MKFFILFILLTISAALAAAAPWAAASVSGTASTLVSVLSTPLATVLCTAIGSALTLVYTKRWDYQKQIEQQHRLAKAPVYTNFVGFLFKLLLSKKDGGEPLSETELLNSVLEFTQHLIIWGADDVVREFGEYRTVAVDQNQSENNELVRRLASLLLAIRSDMGHKNTGLGETEMLRLFLNDAENLSKTP